MPVASKAVRPSRMRGHVMGPVPGAIAIVRPVGAGGANRREDTLGLQVALNAVPLSLAGAGESLKTDGIIGPRTLGAIRQFQDRWMRVKDGRCDPAGPTLRLMNRMAGVGDVVPTGVASFRVAARPFAAAAPKPAGPTSTQQAAIRAAEERHFLVHRVWLPLVHRWLVSTLRLTAAATRYANALQTGHGALPGQATSADRRAFLFLAKHFRLHESKPAACAAAAARVDMMVRRAIAVVPKPTEAVVPSMPPAAQQPGKPLVFVSLWGQPTHVRQDAAAYATAGGLWSQPNANTGWLNPFEVPPPLHARSEARGQIFLTPRYDTVSSDIQRMILVHELMHALGPSDSQPHAIHDPAYVHEHAKYKLLNGQQRLDNADNYAMFVFEAMRGTTYAINEASANTDVVPAYPLMEQTPVWNTDPDPAMPPPGHPAGAGLNFPGGFH